MTRSTFSFLALMVMGAASQQAVWSQCGGQYYTGPTNCADGSVCSQKDQWYSQCVPGDAVVQVQDTPTTFATLAKTATSSAASAPTGSSDQTKYAGINIAGFDFACTIDGKCPVEKTYGPVTAENDGIAQMQHFVNDDKLNAFRLPVAWQYLVNAQVGGSLDTTNFGSFDKLMQGCLATGALCIIDIHNYARWDNGIIGQGGPSNDDFTDLWTRLAKNYAGSKNVGFGIMNEPHEVDIDKWADTVQAVVKAIRDAGASSHYIFLPGNDFASAGAFVTNSAPALSKVKNPDGSTDNLIFEVHRYLDADNSGKSTECTGDSIDNTFAPLADWLRTNKRMAFVGEIGGGNTDSCVRDVCAALRYMDKNADVYFGYTGWAAGSFQSNYELSLRPTGSEDSMLAKQCFSRA